MESQDAPEYITYYEQPRRSLDVPNRLHQTVGVHPHRSSCCGVCLTEIEYNQATYTHLDCFNSYHSTCLEPWMEGSNECPSCRKVLHYNNLYDALTDIDNFDMLADVIPDMDEAVSKWRVRDIEPDMEEEDWLVIEEARMPVPNIATQSGMNQDQLSYWKERRINKTIRPDYQAHSRYQQECDRATADFQDELRNACHQFLAADDLASEGFVYQLTTRRYLAHYDSWSHTRSQELLRENNTEEPGVEQRIVQLFNPNECKHIKQEFIDLHEPLREVFYQRQFRSQYLINESIRRAKIRYIDALKNARIRIERSNWNHNPHDRLKGLRDQGILVIEFETESNEGKDGQNLHNMPGGWIDTDTI